MSADPIPVILRPPTAIISSTWSLTSGVTWDPVRNTDSQTPYFLTWRLGTGLQGLCFDNLGV